MLGLFNFLKSINDAKFFSRLFQFCCVCYVKKNRNYSTRSVASGHMSCSISCVWRRSRCITVHESSGDLWLGVNTHVCPRTFFIYIYTYILFFLLSILSFIFFALFSSLPHHFHFHFHDTKLVAIMTVMIDNKLLRRVRTPRNHPYYNENPIHVCDGHHEFIDGHNTMRNSVIAIVI